MTPLFFLLYIIYMASIGSQAYKKTHLERKFLPCDGHQAQLFTKQDIMGTWYLVAAIPNPRMLPMKYAPCYKMELSESNEAEVRWLVRKKIDNPSQEFVRKLTGTIIRQRFYSQKPFDIWSKGHYTARGCFRQLLSLEINNTNVGDGVYFENYMQLHIIDPKDTFSGGPYLLQVFWSRVISALIYRRSPGISPERVEPIHEFLTEIRGHQEPTRICDTPRKPIPRFPFERP